MSLIGRLLYKFYYGPKNRRVTIAKYGGDESYRAMLASEQEMKQYALNELVLKGKPAKNGKFTINFLTGDKYIHQSLFCVYSFFKHLAPAEQEDFSVCFYSDGSLSEPVINIMETRFPQIKLTSYSSSELNIQENLPKTVYPYLNEKLHTLPLFKKLIYPNLNKSGLSIFFDSDMLFMKKPVEFINWLYQAHGNSDMAFCIQDVIRSYGYADEQINQINPSPQNNINSGMYAVHNSHIDFGFIEKTGSALEQNFGSQYYIEQLITAIILSRSKKLHVADGAEYIVMPTDEQIRTQSGTLHHYVDTSKALYFKEGWRKQLIS